MRNRKVYKWSILPAFSKHCTTLQRKNLTKVKRLQTKRLKMDRWALVPIFNSDLGFFDRQRFLFNDWLHRFDEDFRALDMHNSMLRFDRELDRIRDSLFTLGDASGSGNESNKIDSPFVTDAQGNRKLALRYDVSQFAPEEVTVKTTDNEIQVHAKHQEESEGRKVHREYSRKFVLPENIDPKTLKATLAKDGVLHVEAPAPKALKQEAPKENLVPIEMAK